jgi:IclR family acetate operon transcriptional repressor
VAVKQLQTLQRGLATIEAIAEHHPIGLTELARLLQADKSALQRVLATLHECGWIAPSRQDPARWALTSRPLLVTARAQQRSGIVQRVRPLLEQLRNQLDETVFYAVPEGDEVVIIDVAESRQLSRVAPHAGITLSATASAAGKALATPGTWAIDSDVISEGTTSVATALTEAGQRAGAIAVSAPSARMPRRQQEEIGRTLVAAAMAEFGER